MPKKNTKDTKQEQKRRLYQLLKSGLFEEVNPNLITKNILLQLSFPESETYYISVCGTSLILEILEQGHIKKLPQKVLTKKLLTGEGGREGRTILMEVIKSGHIDIIPKKLLTIKNMTKQDRFGNTGMHYATEGEKLDALPKFLLKVDILTLKNQRGKTCMHHLCRNGEFKKLPQKILKEETLLGNNPSKIDPIDEFYTFCIAKDKNALKFVKLLETLTQSGLNYIAQKGYIIADLAKAIIKTRRIKTLSARISNLSKSWELP
jgi:hypothetical protein